MLCAAVALSLAANGGYTEQWWGKNITPGVAYYHIVMGPPSWINHVHVLKIDASSPAISVRPVLAYDRVGRLEKVSHLCRRTHALAAINGSFYTRKQQMSLPIGITAVDGEVIQKSRLHRTTLGITDNGRFVMGVPKVQFNVDLPAKDRRVELWGINRPRKQDEIILYTPAYGRTTRTNLFGVEVIVRQGRVVQQMQGNSPIPEDGYVLSFHGISRAMASWFLLGDRVRRTFYASPGWEDVVHAISGGPRLVANGRVLVNLDRERFGRRYRVPHPRTAVGVAGEQRLILVVVDGRQPGYSVGMTFTELARLLVRLGAKDAMGLDSGGSSAMAIGGRLVNRPSEGYERPASNALAVWYHPPKSERRADSRG